MKKVAGSLRLDLAQFRELEAFASLGTELDAATQQQIDRGGRLVNLLVQGQYSPMPVEKQVVSIFAGTKGYMDKVPLDKVFDYEDKLLAHIEQTHKELFSAISETKQLPDESKLSKLIEDFTAAYLEGKAADVR